MKSEFSKQEIKEKMDELFSKNPCATEIKKIKKLASSKNIKLGDMKRKFCRNCNSLFSSKNSEIRIKKGFKVIRCKECLNVSRYKLKN